MSTEITNNAEQSRYEIHLDGKLAGFAAYRLSGDGTVFPHTEIDPAFEGHGPACRPARGLRRPRAGRHAGPWPSKAGSISVWGNTVPSPDSRYAAKPASLPSRWIS